MASMKEIREHIASIQSTQKVTNAMYLIASTKMRRAKEDLAKTRPFFDAVSTQIEQIFQHAGEIESPYLYRGNADDLAQPGTYAYLVVTADTRPCGRLQPECYSGDDEAALKSTPTAAFLWWAATGGTSSPATACRWKRASATMRRAPRSAARERSRRSF